MNRRNFIRNTTITVGGVVLLGGGLYWYTGHKHKSSQQVDDEETFRAMVRLISPKLLWHSSDLTRFIEELNAVERTSLLKALDKEGNLSSENILKELRWVSSNIISYPFRDKADFDYHRLVQWTARNVGVDSSFVENEATFSIESRMVGAIFKELWDSLTKEQRVALLEEIDKNGVIVNKAAIASLGGAAALATLSATFYFTGFAFYTTMTTVMFTVAGFFGITLPFAAYTGASSIVAILSGPIGWALLAIAATAGIATEIVLRIVWVQLSKRVPSKNPLINVFFSPVGQE